MTTYTVFLALHSWGRWLVLGFGLWAIWRALTADKQVWTKADNIAGASFVGSMHLQLLIGLVLYLGLSPWGLHALQTGGAAVMKDRTGRFFAVEHLVGMLLAVVCAQVGRSLSKKQVLIPARHQKALVWFGVALVLVLLMIPWGIWNPARPMLR